MTDRVKLDNWPKFIFACLSMLCMTILMIQATVSSEVGVPFLTAIAGYILGNGVRAVREESDQALFYARRKNDPQS